MTVPTALQKNAAAALWCYHPLVDAKIRWQYPEALERIDYLWSALIDESEELFLYCGLSKFSISRDLHST